jgi:MFS family permease
MRCGALGIDEAKGPWWRELNRYHWYVLVVCALGWLFDTMDQQLFVLVRGPSVENVLGLTRFEREENGAIKRDEKGVPKRIQLTEEEKLKKNAFGGYATAIFLVGWATGGLVFGMFGDRLGRARTMMITILIYSVFTGLSAIALGWWDYAIYRFLTGMGVGGEFAAGVALVAEVMPARVRPYALGLLQAFSAVGNMTAAVITMVIKPDVVFFSLGEGADSTPVLGWRFVYLVGILPSLLLIFIRSKLKEPDSWQAAKDAEKKRPDDATKQLGDMAEMFRNPELRYRTIIGVLLAMSGVMMLWGAGFFVPELIRNHIGLTTDAEKSNYVSVGMFLQNLGSFFGVCAFSFIAPTFGRRPAFAISYLVGFAAIFWVFAFMTDKSQIYYMMPIMGFCVLMVFGGFAIYFPELFPTRLRSTGTGFCYNVARYLAASGPMALPVFGSLYLSSDKARSDAGLASFTLFSSWGGSDEAFRYATISIAMIAFVGLFTLIFAPETKDKPLPE